MNDRDIDRALANHPPVDRRLLDRVATAIPPDVAPVRPLPPRSILTARLIAAGALAAVAGASVLGFNAVPRLAAVQAAVIFPALLVLICMAAVAATAAMVPGSRQLVRPGSLIVLACAAMAGIFALVFQDYSVAHFVRQGVPCLIAGTANAVPAALLAWFILRRGFAVRAISAGAAAGALAGLAGVLMLALHCPLFQAPHAMFWHVAVIPCSAAAGAVVARVYAGLMSRASV